MFDIFKGPSNDVKVLRSSILQFIKEQLQKAEGGEGGNIKGLTLYLACKPHEQHLYEAAVYAADESRFKEEDVQKIADDYAIALPANWTLEIAFVSSLPADAVKAQKAAIALLISTNKKPDKTMVVQSTTAVIKVLNGEAEKDEYVIEHTMGKINIGREKNTFAADGFVRENHLVFPGNSSHKSNPSVSRQHAHIEWNTNANAFYIFADEGGIPPHNKTKIKAKEGPPVKLQTTQIGHRLHNGDQVVLGESAVLEFREG